MIDPLLGAATITAGGALASSLFGGGKKTKVKEPDEVIAARRKLWDFATTGTYGGFTAGTPYTGSLGSYTPTGVETASLGRLGSFVNSSNPALFSAGEGALTDLLSGDRFDPYSPTGEYAGFKRDVEKQLDEGATRLKRNAAFSRSLYSGNTVKQLGNLEEEGQAQLNSKMAELYDKFVSRKIAAIPEAFSAAGQAQDMEAQRIGAGFQYGGLERELADAEAKARLSEWLRQRQELLLPMNSAESVMGSGFSEFSLPGVNPLSDTFSNLSGLGMQELIRQLFNQQGKSKVGS